MLLDYINQSWRGLSSVPEVGFPHIPYLGPACTVGFRGPVDVYIYQL